MKSLIIGMALAAAAFPALAQTNVSISVGQPGFYGRIDIGDFGPPPVVYTQPVIIAPRPYYEPAPIYLRVPEGHRKHWAKWCGRYNACGQRVYFVRDDWYLNTYAPRVRTEYRQPVRVVQERVYERAPQRVEYREEHDEGHGHGHGYGHGNGHGHGHGHDD
jgi:hypothetical protein